MIVYSCGPAEGRPELLFIINSRAELSIIH